MRGSRMIWIYIGFIKATLFFKTFEKDLKGLKENLIKVAE